jgi:hypothetical protein
MKSYEDAIGEAVQLLISHGEQPGPVTEHLFERLRRDPELQTVLLGEPLPDDESAASGIIHGRGVEAVHGLMNRALNRLRHGMQQK